MSRQILDEARIHPAIRDKVATHNADIVKEVMDAVAAHAVVIVGMRQNLMPRHARKLLNQDNIPHKYLEYGSYLGGASDLARLKHSGELAKLLS